MKKTLIVKQINGKTKEILISKDDLEKIECGAMRIRVDNQGSEYLSVTQQLNPRWENNWDTDKHFIKEENNISKVIYKYLPLKMYKLEKRREQKKKQELIEQRNLNEIIEYNQIEGF